MKYFRWITINGYITNLRADNPKHLGQIIRKHTHKDLKDAIGAWLIECVFTINKNPELEIMQFNKTFNIIKNNKKVEYFVKIEYC